MSANLWKHGQAIILYCHRQGFSFFFPPCPFSVQFILWLKRSIIHAGKREKNTHISFPQTFSLTVKNRKCAKKRFKKITYISTKSRAHARGEGNERDFASLKQIPMFFLPMIDWCHFFAHSESWERQLNRCRSKSAMERENFSTKKKRGGSEDKLSFAVVVRQIKRVSLLLYSSLLSQTGNRLFFFCSKLRCAASFVPDKARKLDATNCIRRRCFIIFYQRRSRQVLER